MKHKKPRTPEHKQKIAAALRGKKKTEKHKAALRNHVRTEEHCLNLKISLNSSSVKEKRQETMIDRYGVAHIAQLNGKNHFSETYWTLKGFSSIEAKKIVSAMQKKYCKLRKNVVSHWSISYWINKGFSLEESKSKISALQSVNASKSIFTISKSETSFLDKLEKELNIKIERTVPLFDKFVVDGLIIENKIVIEYFGDFWHMNPNLYSELHVNRVTGRTAGGQWAEDDGRIKYLSKAGYKVFVVWESESEEESIRKIKEEINNESY